MNSKSKRKPGFQGKQKVRRRIQAHYPTAKSLTDNPKETMKRIIGDNKPKRKSSTDTPVTARDMSALRTILKIIIGDGGQPPLLGMDSARVKLLMQGGSQFLNRVGGQGAKPLTEGEQSMAVWLRRLITADLYAQGLTNNEIAQRMRVSLNTVDADINSIAESRIFSERVEDAQAAIAKSMNRLETLQRSAMMDLADRPLPVSERGALRMEITSRELYIFKTLRDLGFFSAIERQHEPPPAETPKGTVNVFLNAPQPNKPMEDMSTEERLQFMETYMAFRRSNHQVQGTAQDVEFSEVSHEKDPTRKDKPSSPNKGRKAFPSAGLSRQPATTG